MPNDISAFPINPPLDPGGGSAAGYPWPESGMTLRDYFAAKAMQGWYTTIGMVGGTAPSDADIARSAYEMADAMLKAREDK